ncbi:hypothetical protein BsWGS_19123 [Bradybaena similaris]
MSVLKDLLKVWKTLVLLCIPLIACPILTIDGSKEMACLYGVFIMAAYWITEALPLAVTAFLPVLLFPVLGVLPARVVAANYVKDATMFSFSCLVFALCVERWNLHRRIALGTLLLMGSSPKWLVLGFMLPTWFLSMWMNNTSATAMMIPVVIAVLEQLHELELSKQQTSTGFDSKDEAIPMKERDVEDIGNVNTAVLDTGSYQYPSEQFKHMCKALSLCVCYAAGLGGIGSITGSSTNLVMQGQADAIFAAYGLDSGVNFLTWLMCCLPAAALCLIVAWIWLVFHFFGLKELLKFECGDKEQTEATRTVVRAHLHKLGPLSFAEKAVVGHFIVLVALWLSMEIPGGVGWAYFFKPDYVNNSTPGILIVVSMFIFPSERPRVFCWSKADKENELPRSVPALLDWKSVQEQFPWGTWCLLGGGYALASICQDSGLSLWIGSRLSMFASMEPWLMVLILTLAISFMTEITSNAASASILCPILAELAISLQVNPLYLLYPAVLACSMAFILPVATPPNAIVFAIGHVKVKDMAKAGFILNILCVLVINVAINTWMSALLQLHQLPLAMTRNPQNESRHFQSNNDVLAAFNTTAHPL